MIVRLHHLRGVTGFNSRPGLCVRGTRQMAKQLGLDWDDFRRNGIDAEKLTATGNAFALALVAHARAIEEAGHGR